MLTSKYTKTTSKQQKENSSISSSTNRRNNRLKGLSLFANIGIAETYLQDIGIDIVFANEIVAKRANLYQFLYPETEMIIEDIQNPQTKKTIIRKAQEQNIEFIIATPPCQGMSSAGKKIKLDPRNNLIKDTIEIVSAVQPIYAMFENVPQQQKTVILHDGVETVVPQYIKKSLCHAYHIHEKEIDCSEYGVPQSRKRYVFLLTRKDEPKIWTFPERVIEKGKTLRELLQDVPPLDPLLKEGIEETLKMFPKYEKKLHNAAKVSKWHRPVAHPKRQVICMQRTPTGCSAFHNPEEFQPVTVKGTKVKGFPNTYKRQGWDRPAYTITCYNRTISSQENVHPGNLMENGLYDSPRVFTVYELILMMSLPPNWNLPDSVREPFLREVLGEGFPPKAVQHLCSRIPRLIGQGKQR